MKHNLNVTIILIAIFIITQIVGLTLINLDIKSVQNVNGTITINHQETAIGPRPQTEGAGSFIYLSGAVFIGTILVLILIRYKKRNLWKTWFFLAVVLSITIALGTFLSKTLALILAIIFAIMKLYKPNILTHNLSEVLIYSGIAVLIVPILDIFWVTMLLIIISFYDMFAVWKSKHMIKMAEFQTKSNVFAGIMIPYEQKEQHVTIKTPIKAAPMIEKSQTTKKNKEIRLKNAILGGGDVAFPLIFSGVAMENFILKGLSPIIAFQQSLVIVLFTTIAVFGLFTFAKKNKFYPAMPFITIGCLVGYAITLLI